MQWPTWLLWRKEADNDSTTTAPSPISVDNTPSSTTTSSPSPLSPSNILTTHALVPSLLLTGTTLLALSIYKSRLRQIPSTAHIKPAEFRTRSLYGYVTSVGDGDNFRLFHTPGGRGMGWGWAPGRRGYLFLRQTRGQRDSSASSSSSSTAASSGPASGHSAGSGGNAKTPTRELDANAAKKIRDSTLHIRIAGVDAPELAHFGRPSQPFGQEALVFLRGLVLGRYVRAYIHRRDQYERVVATVYVRAGWTGLWRRRDVGLEMLRAGVATVYEAKVGSEFAGLEQVYTRAEKEAKRRGLGMWASGRGRGLQEVGWFGWLSGREKGVEEVLESPREYKNRMRAMEEGQAGKKK